MYDNVLKATRDEVLRLLKGQQSIYGSLLESEIWREDKDPNQRRTIDRADLTQWVQILKEEEYKAERLEMTLAVVGTMKAGKSTTINAIIGSEILPNRNQPMTTLPTLIRHVPGQIEPKLIFPYPKPFNDAIQKLQAILKKLASSNSYFFNEVSATDDGQALLDDIMSGTRAQVNAEYHGTDEIYSFLKIINDICRLCDDPRIGLDSPLLEYQSIEEFPVIEVEFFHLKAHPGSQLGQFTLIDTPGPNEAGQLHLRNILDAQLQKASAVLTIMDYTQLNSEAEYQVREALNRIAEQAEDRLYVFVNRFDQKDSNGMSEREVSNYVSRKLFEGRVPVERIYPTSAKYAYLANRALSELDRNGRLTYEGEKNAWVADFGSIALGRFWKNALDNTSMLKEAAECIWQESLFDKPLNEVIVDSFQRSALISLSATIAKLEDYSSRLIDYMNFRSDLTTMDLKKIQEHIKGLEEDIRSIEAVKKISMNKAITTINQMGSQIKDIFNEMDAQVGTEIEVFFKIGKRQEADSKRKARETQRKRSIFSRRNSRKLTQVSEQINDQGPNKFETEKEAAIFMNRINNALTEYLESGYDALQTEISKRVGDVEQQLWKTVRQELAPTLKAAKERLQEDFQLRIEFPQPDLRLNSINFDRMINAQIKRTTEQRTGVDYVRRWYTLWLVKHAKTYTYNQDVYLVDTRKIGRDLQKRLEVQQKELEKRVRQFIDGEVRSTVEEYFSQLEDYLERFRGDMLDSIKDQQLGAERLGKLEELLRDSIAQMELYQNDIVAAKEGLHSENQRLIAQGVTTL